MVGIWQFSQLLDVIFEWTTMFGKMSADGKTDEVMVQLARITVEILAALETQDKQQFIMIEVHQALENLFYYVK